MRPRPFRRLDACVSLLLATSLILLKFLLPLSMQVQSLHSCRGLLRVQRDNEHTEQHTFAYAIGGINRV